MSGPVVLLLSDTVDSTHVTERVGEETIASLWQVHDRAARDLIRKWRGREIDKSDGFLILFESASDATGYAFAYHRALARLPVPLKARVGIHLGPVTVRANTADDIAAGAKPLEVDGLAKAIASRVMSVAQGAQTLVTAEVLASLVAAPLRTSSCGHWRLRGLHDPIEIFEVSATESLIGTPPETVKGYRVARSGELWLPVRSVPHNLPAERDAFVGREQSIRDLSRLFESGARLISIVGAGGTGKTRVARRFAWLGLGDFQGGVWFCDLSQARSLDGVVFAVASALDVPLGDGDPVAQLSNAIAGRGEFLLILDNFEQVSAFTEETVGRWMDRAALARFLVTSREVLSVSGEVVLTLAPLPHEDGVVLFNLRAASVSCDFDPAAAGELSIKTLVQLLDGLPLAIELAAARVRVMSPKALLARMSDRFRLLASHGGREQRQATLRTAFDWSWDLLSPAEKSALAQLSVFEGGFTLQAAEAVLDQRAVEVAAWPVDLVQSLLDKSLIRRAGDYRFNLLLSLQEYAAEHLETAGSFHGSGEGATEASQARHWRYFAAFDEASAIADRCADADNLIVACRRAAVRCDAKAAAGTLLGAWAVLALRGPYRAAAEMADSVLHMRDVGPMERACAEFVKGSAMFMMGRAPDARACVDRGLVQLVESFNPAIEARLRCLRGELLTEQARHAEALNELEVALALARAPRESSLKCKILNGLTALALSSGHLATARSHCEAALLIAREAGDERWEGGLLGNLALLDYSEGSARGAIERYNRALELARRTGDRRWEGNARCNLGLLFHEQGQPAEAQLEFQAALEIARNIGHLRLECTVLCNLGIAVEALKQPDAALEYYEHAAQLAQELDDRRVEGQCRTFHGLCHGRRGDFSEARKCLDDAQQLLLQTADRLSLGLLHCARSEVEYLAGDRQRAIAEVRRAEEFATDAGTSVDSELGRRISALRPLLATPGNC